MKVRTGKRALAGAIVLLLILLAAISVLRWQGYDGWDKAAADAVADWRSDAWTSAGRLMNELGATAAIGAITILSAAYWGLRREWKVAFSFVGVVLLAYLLQMSLKAAFGWERPGGAWGIDHDGYGYPSGNASIAAALYGWWLLLAGYMLRSRLMRVVVGAIAVLMIVATCWSRVYFSVHYLSDVAAGCCVGGICALAAGFICFWRRRSSVFY
ncbi:phosphatase PAP2 family protein [Cohnella sp. 56]|uniref:phosphatase PAP2 family protein n=1 Tax=Cohnella sp. 56 TaxID=3113722 RepID=UPI0030E992C8